MPSLRCTWEVRAGLIPGQVMSEKTERFHLTSEEWERSGGLQEFMNKQATAQAYAAYLQLLCANGREVNWTEITFIWY